MEKIKLNDGTVIGIQSGCNEFAIGIIAESVDETVAHFTDSNLERYEILTVNDDVCAVYTKKHMKNFSAVLTEDGYLITVHLMDIDEMAERVTALEETVDVLVMESLGV